MDPSFSNVGATHSDPTSPASDLGPANPASDPTLTKLKDESPTNPTSDVGSVNPASDPSSTNLNDHSPANPASDVVPAIPASDPTSTNLKDQGPVSPASDVGTVNSASDPSSTNLNDHSPTNPASDVGPANPAFDSSSTKLNDHSPTNPASDAGPAIPASDPSSANLKDHSPTKESASSDLSSTASAYGVAAGGGGSTNGPSLSQGATAVPVPVPDVGPTISTTSSDLNPTNTPASHHIAATDSHITTRTLDLSLTDNPALDVVAANSDHASHRTSTTTTDELSSVQDSSVAAAASITNPLSDLSPSDLASSVHVPAAYNPPSDVGPTAEPAPSASTPLHACPHTDSEIVHKLAQLLLPGLATACVDSTTGDLFRSPATVAVDLRRELTDHLTLRSDTYVPETLSLLHSPDSATLDLPDLDDPLDILAALLDEFTATKRNLLGRVSNWLLSDSREDKIDEFVQEMEMNNFWKLSLREVIADLLLKNLDYKNVFHCSMKFDMQEELEKHLKECSFRPVSCKNDGCKVKYCEVHEEKHEEVCPYKVLECEQRCGERIVRREMDRHCITVCTMKMVNCPFYQVGCQSAFPQCQLRTHCREFLRLHLLGILCVKNEEGLGEDELKAKAESMSKSQFREELAQALDLRPLTVAAKSVEAKMKKQREQEKYTHMSAQA